MTLKEEFGGPKGGRPRSIRSQQAILDATLVLLATEGFAGMSIESVAVQAGAGKKTIYRWWDSKEDLVIDAIRTLQETQNPVIATGSLRDDLTAIFRNTFQAWSGVQARGLVLRLLGEITTHPRIYQALYDQVLSPRLQQFTQVIQLAQVQGELRLDIDANEIMGLLAGPIWYHLFFDTFAENNPPPAIDLPERLADAILQGIMRQGK